MIMNLFHLVLFLNIPILLANLLDTPIKSVVDLEQHLFPNRSLSGTSTPIYQQGGLRRLDANPTSIPTPSPFSYPCTVCRGLSACSILNGFMVEEVYYPNNLLYLETCKVLESLGKRMEGQIFGTGRTFRDTPQCRLMVMEYLCLFYGSNNTMYTNHCVGQEEVKSPNPANHRVAPRPPCRSFCVQIAAVCANDPDFFLQTCQNIRCPPAEATCTPDPTLNGEVLAANLGCTVPYYFNPYFRSAAATSGLSSFSLLLAFISISIISWIQFL